MVLMSVTLSMDEKESNLHWFCSFFEKEQVKRKTECKMMAHANCVLMIDNDFRLCVGARMCNVCDKSSRWPTFIPPLSGSCA